MSAAPQRRGAPGGAAEPPAPGDVHVRLTDVHKRFGSHEVLRGVDLEVVRGAINIIIGGSGTGKSVVVKHVIGLLKPDRGSIVIDGEDIVPMSDFALARVRRKMAMLFQYSALFDSMTVEENVAFPLLEHRTDLGRDQVRAIVADKLGQLGIGRQALPKSPAEISGGMRKRVALARALVMEPEILIYDEPTTGLDPIATQNVDEMIVETARSHGVTSIVISHDMASAFRIAHRITMLHEGRAIASGTPAEVLGDPHPYLRRFIETSGVKLA